MFAAVVAVVDPPHETGKRFITKCMCVLQIDVLTSKIVLQDQSQGEHRHSLGISRDKQWLSVETLLQLKDLRGDEGVSDAV